MKRNVMRIIAVAVFAFLAGVFLDVDIVRVSAAVTTDGYIEISTIDQLYGIRNNSDANYRLVCDIDLTEATSEGGSWDAGFGWNPIPEFSGKFDGAGYRINGLHIYGKPNVKNLGLFGNVTGTITRLSMTDVSIVISECDSTYYIGAIAGSIDGAVVSECYVEGHIDATGCYFEKTGGIIGLGEESIIKDCISDCRIEAYQSGGIAGDAWYCNVTNCYNIGAISVKEAEYCTAMGQVHNDFLKNCYYMKGTAKQGGYHGDYEGHVSVLSESMMRFESSFSGFDFEKTWIIDPDCDYKYPQLRNNRIVRVSAALVEPLHQESEYQTDEAEKEDDAEKVEKAEEPLESEYNDTVDIEADYELEVGETAALLVKKASKKAYESSNPEVVTVTKKGKIKAIAAGTATITVKDKTTAEITGSYLVKVNGEPEADIELCLGDTVRFPKVKGAKEIISSDPEIVTVINGKKFSARKTGIAVITFVNEKGKTIDSYVVAVVEEEQE